MENNSENPPFSLKEFKKGILELYKDDNIKKVLEGIKEMKEIFEPIKQIKELFEVWNFVLSFRNIRKGKDGNGGDSSII